MNLNKKPYFIHDCSICIFLGSTKTEGLLRHKHKKYKTKFDIYFCQGSLVLRYGNEGQDYTSAPINIIEINYLNHPDPRFQKKWKIAYETYNKYKKTKELIEAMKRLADKMQKAMEDLWVGTTPGKQTDFHGLAQVIKNNECIDAQTGKKISK